MTKQDLIDLFRLKSQDEHIPLEAAADLLANYVRANLNVLGDRELVGLLEIGAILIHLAEEDGWLYNRKLSYVPGAGARDDFLNGPDNFNRFLNHDRGFPCEPLSAIELRTLKRMRSSSYAVKPVRPVQALHTAAPQKNDDTAGEVAYEAVKRETITEDELSVMIQEFQDRHPSCSGMRYDRPSVKPLDHDGVNWDRPALRSLSSSVAPACHYVMEAFLASLQARFNLDEM